ncbi:MAG: phospho-sugar mutase [Polyangiaceae bacterium]
MSARERAESWIAHDPDPSSRAELEALLSAARGGDAEAERDIGERFSGPLEFGTAGLRGVLGAGESRMNIAVIRRTAHGLGKYLLEKYPESAPLGVAVGYDGRRFSRVFAETTASVLAALGIPTYLSPTLCPTPVTAFAVSRIGAAAGVMVTASHNPPEYNGFKVYWQNGAQIIPPHDTGIAAAIAAAPPADEVPTLAFEDARERGLVREFPSDLEDSYLARVQALSLQRAGDRDAPIVHTSLHGVGDRMVRETLRRAGFTDVRPVAAQAEPNGDFPTVAFPNPEEKGALDLAIALAEESGADLIIANDPDVDRLAIAVRNPETRKFTQLTGNQVGVLLGHYLLTEVADPSSRQGTADRLVIATCVSSPQLGAIARALGVHYEETLTGFKWITNRAMELERLEGKRFVFGYEEALGYTVGSLVRDKDGISAALLFAELWAVRRAQGKTIFDELERIARTYGCFVSGQRSITMKGKDGLSRIQSVMSSLRERPLAEMAPLSVVGRSDIKNGVRLRSSGETTKLRLPSSDVLIYDLAGDSRIIARPSGTEPKLKIYIDVREPIAEGEAVTVAEVRANHRLDEILGAFLRVAGLD